jgi:isoquinoline 1-oxidoreductase beta subunit
MESVTGKELSRRDFVARALRGGGFLLGLQLAPARSLLARDAASSSAAGAAEAFRPSAFVAIHASGDVEIVAHRSEMGQGSRTSLPMVVVDELGADWARVRVQQADGAEEVYGSQNTDGSNSVREFYQRMRELGAAARQMLEEAAARRWSVPASEVAVRDHAAVHEATGRRLGFGELAADAARVPVPARESLRLKEKRDLRYVGKGVPSVDAHDITTGRAHYGIDASLPGMRIAVVARPPVYGGRVRSVDAAAALAVPGVERVIQLPAPELPAGFRPLGGVAVVARNTWAAMQGRDRLRIEWDDGPNASYDSAAYRASLEETVRKPGRVERSEGDVERAIGSAARVLRAEYYVPHHAHAPMEPPAALASVADGRCEAWAPSQNPSGARDELEKALGLPRGAVTVHTTLLGGGFGRKSKPDFVLEAALLSREVGAPVKVVWTREDEIRHGYYHTVAAQHLEAALDESGRPTAWLQRSAFPSIQSTFGNADHPADWEIAMGMTDLPYAIPNVRLESGDAPPHVRIGWFRSVCNIPHAFAVSSFADELAHAAGRDPRDYLLELLAPRRVSPITLPNGKPLDDPVDVERLANVVRLVTERAGWGRPLPAGHGVGLAAHRSFGSYVATVVEAAVDPDGSVHVPRAHVALDCGLVVNPDRVHAQLEGATVMGLSLALFGSVDFREGRAVQGNFGDYRLLRFHEAPRQIDTFVVESDQRAGGVGEPGLPPVAPALCNAIFAASGRRVRALPVSSYRSPVTSSQ